MRALALVLGLVMLQGLDFLLTGVLLSGRLRADVYEANPLARHVLSSGGWTALAAFKASCTLVALAAALLVLRQRPAAGRRLLAALCLLMLGVVGYSGVLAAQPEAESSYDQLNEASRQVEQAQQSLAAYVQARKELCVALLAGAYTLDQVVERHEELIERYAEDMVPAYRRTLPRRDEPGAQASFLLQHLTRLVAEGQMVVPPSRLEQIQREADRLARVGGRGV